MPTTFIAVQCFQCSTMQVKQQKKSSNKWTCVVCNEKQSVRKVYAQGLMAKDVRKFVTSFNMSRKFADEQSQNETLVPICEDQIDDQVTCDHRKRRSDWNEYLDVDDDRDDKIEETGDGGGVLEPKIITELPVEMFKKPKLKNYSSGSRIEGSKDLLKPVFSKRNTTNKQIVPQDKEPRQCWTTMKETLKYSDYATQDAKGPQTCQPSMPRVVGSKWNDYITPDEDDSELKSGRDIVDRMGNWSDGALQALFEDQMVEEDIHPDFK